MFHKASDCLGNYSMDLLWNTCVHLYISPYKACSQMHYMSFVTNQWNRCSNISSANKRGTKWCFCFEICFLSHLIPPFTIYVRRNTLFYFYFVWYVEYWSILFSLCWSDVTVRVWADLVQNSSWEHVSPAVQWFSFHKAHVPIAVTTLKPLTGGYTVSWEEYSCSDIKKQVKWKTIDHSLILQWETLTPSINMEVNLTHTTQGFPRLSSCSSLWRAGS